MHLKHLDAPVCSIFPHVTKSGVATPHTCHLGLSHGGVQFAFGPKKMSDPWDVLVVGGGVVGAAIAREFAASGKRVLLCEKEEEVDRQMHF